MTKTIVRAISQWRSTPQPWLTDGLRLLMGAAVCSASCRAGFMVACQACKDASGGVHDSMHHCNTFPKYQS